MLDELKIILKLSRLVMEHLVILLILIIKAFIQGIRKVIIKLWHILRKAFISMKNSLFGEIERENLTLESEEWHGIYCSVALLQTNYELGKLTNKEKAMQHITRLKNRCLEYKEKYKSDMCNRQEQILNELENKMRE